MNEWRNIIKRERNDPFPTIKRQLEVFWGIPYFRILLLLASMGMSSKLLNILQAMYTNVCRMTSFDFFFGVSQGELLLKHSDNLSKTLQASSMSAAERQKVADMSIRIL